jgi:hypothetical protein
MLINSINLREQMYECFYNLCVNPFQYFVNEVLTQHLIFKFA